MLLHLPIGKPARRWLDQLKGKKLMQLVDPRAVLDADPNSPIKAGIVRHERRVTVCLYHANFDNGETGGGAIGVSLTAETIERVMANDLNYSTIKGLHTYAAGQYLYGSNRRRDWRLLLPCCWMGMGQHQRICRSYPVQSQIRGFLGVSRKLKFIRPAPQTWS